MVVFAVVCCGQIVCLALSLYSAIQKAMRYSVRATRSVVEVRSIYVTPDGSSLIGSLVNGEEVLENV